MLKSLSAKIIAAAVLLITVSYAADFLIAANINRTLNAETETLTGRMHSAIGEKDKLIERLLADNQLASETKLNAVLSAATATNTLETEATRKFLEGTRNGIAVSSLTLISNAMLQGEAATAQETMKTLLDNPQIYAINLWRTSGEMAFHDNKTINTINKRADAEIFKPRKAIDPIVLEGDRRTVFNTVVKNHQNGLVALGEES